MAKKRSVIKKEENIKSIFKDWSRTAKEYSFSGLQDSEKDQFRRASFDEEQAKRTPFVLGEPINHYS